MKYSQKTYEGALASLAELREQSTSDSERTTIDFIAEAVAERLLASLPAGLTATQTVAGDELRGDVRSGTPRVSEQNAGGASADYIPDEEIPWDFLNP